MATREEVYAKFGVAAEAAQLFETDLGTILLASEGKLRDWHVSPDPDEATKFYEKLNRKTLGQLLDAVSKLVPLDDGIAAAFERGLTARNRLNHGFFERHNFAIHDPQGRQTMIAELEELHSPLFNAWQVASGLAGALVNQLMAARS